MKPKACVCGNTNVMFRGAGESGIIGCPTCKKVFAYSDAVTQLEAEGQWHEWLRENRKPIWRQEDDAILSHLHVGGANQWLVDALTSYITKRNHELAEVIEIAQDSLDEWFSSVSCEYGPEDAFEDTKEIQGRLNRIKERK